jgi:hypothetical protein
MSLWDGFEDPLNPNSRVFAIHNAASLAFWWKAWKVNMTSYKFHKGVVPLLSKNIAVCDVNENSELY